MPSRPNRHILQVLPSSAWKAVYEREGKIVKSDLVAFALLDEHGARRVAGLDPAPGNGIGLCEERPGFLGYAGLDDDINWYKLAKKIRKARRKKSKK